MLLCLSTPKHTTSHAPLPVNTKTHNIKKCTHKKYLHLHVVDAGHAYEKEVLTSACCWCGPCLCTRSTYICLIWIRAMHVHKKYLHLLAVDAGHACVQLLTSACCWCGPCLWTRSTYICLLLMWAMNKKYSHLLAVDTGHACEQEVSTSACC